MPESLDYALTHGEYDMVGLSSAMQKQVYDVLGKIKNALVPVLIMGERGTGKELIARAIHKYSFRASRPFVAVNIATIPSELVESELFGHLKGAYSNALKERNGLFESANSGTLFLHEIGEMDPSLQAKLLRAVEYSEIRKVGSDETNELNPRIVCSTNRDLKLARMEGRFRDDLYDRLAKITITTVPLREKREDIPYLIGHFTNRLQKQYGDMVPFTEQEIQAYQNYHWPGNVRELDTAVERCFILKANKLAVLDQIREESSVTGDKSKKSGKIQESDPVTVDSLLKPDSSGRFPTLKEAEKILILTARESTHDLYKIARLTGLSRRTIHRRLREYGIERKPGVPFNSK